MNNQPDPQVAKIVKALALTENGGKVDVQNPKSGQSGEMKSIFQFTPGTWKMYSKEVSGQDNLPMNATNEAAVVYGKVSNWLQDGLKPDEIASIWNSGKPDTYLYDSSGTNKYGVKYNVSDYVNKFNEHLNHTGDIGQSSQTPPSTPPPTQSPIQPQIQGSFAQSSPVGSQTPSSVTKTAPQSNTTLPQLMKSNQMKQAKQI